MPIGIYVTGHDDSITLAHNHVHHLGNDNTTLGSFDINAHGIAVYGRDPRQPISRLRIVGNEVDHLKLGASEAVVVNGNVNRWSDQAQPDPRREQHRHRRDRLRGDGARHSTPASTAPATA